MRRVAKVVFPVPGVPVTKIFGTVLLTVGIAFSSSISLSISTVDLDYNINICDVYQIAQIAH